MSPTATIVVLWLAFAASHMSLSSVRLRPRIVAAIGERAFLGIYSLLAIALFVPMVSVYFRNKHSGPLLWSIDVSPPIEVLISIGMGVALVLLVASLVTPSPASMQAIGQERIAVTGVHRLTRHALFMALGLFGLLHLIPNGFGSDIAFFGGFPIFAVLGSVHQDQRKLQTDADRYRDFHASTPLLLFTGRETLRGLRELPPIAYALGIGLAIGLRVFHSQIFG